MSRVIRADVDGRILAWARTSLRMTVPVAARKLGVQEEQIVAWEQGQASPTIPQLRKAARAYGQSFAVFFLPEPPKDFDPDLSDYRRAVGVARGELSSDFLLDLRTSAERRQSYLEVLQASGKEVAPFPLRADVNEDPEAVGRRFRNALAVPLDEQFGWRDERIAFNSWRATIERAHVLVFQTANVSLSEMRAYSIAEFPYPVVAVNRKDLYRARTFSLIHELCHLALRRAGICDLRSSLDLPPEDQAVEVFCNAVAASTLLPRASFLADDVVARTRPGDVSEAAVRSVARRYSVSGEVVFRRLLTLGKATEDEYRQYRRDVEAAYRTSKPSRKGFVPPPTDVLSKAGRSYTRTVMAAHDEGVLTGSDASTLLDVRLKHLDSIGALLEE